MSLKHKLAEATAALALATAALAFSGCGTPAAPQPPSLNLPEPVQDLIAERAGSQVTLHWTMPKKTTDKVLLNSPVEARIGRAEPGQKASQAGTVTADPNVAGAFQENLPSELQSGPPRILSYSVELVNKRGRSAGPSNIALVLAGAAPAPIHSLAAEAQANGVALHWSSNAATAVRLHRRLLTPVKRQKNATAEPLELNLLVPAPTPGQETGALDPSARFGETYEYTVQPIAQPIAQAAFNGKTLELPGEVSAPIKIDVIDTFPPAIPQGLATIWVAEEKTIDISWQPDTDTDLAGYIVYRAEGEGAWTRISPATPLTSPAYRDATAQPGHSYRYAVSAIDQTGNESRRSIEAEENVPNP